MEYSECVKLYEDWELIMQPQIFFADEWRKVTDIKEDILRGWMVRVEGVDNFILLEGVKKENIQIIY